MKSFSKQGALTEAELDRLGDFLSKSKGGKAMNLEELDGFFACLIAGPDLIPPSEYLPKVFGGDLTETCEFDGPEEANDILGLIMRHWNVIATTLQKNAYLPLLLEDDNGVSQASDWARGFMRGTTMRHDTWKEFIDDEEHCAWMLPMMILYHERDEDPALRPPPIPPEKREDLLVSMIAGVRRIYQYFRQHHQPPAPVRPIKVGRNDPCPCGSGKKYKRCCGSVTIH